MEKNGELMAVNMLKETLAKLEKTSDLELFQIDQLLQIIKTQFAPLVIMGANFKILLAYSALKKIIENMKKDKTKAQEKTDNNDERWGYPSEIR